MRKRELMSAAAAIVFSAGRPYWYGRPWVRRPYYGTIVAGVALGTSPLPTLVPSHRWAMEKYGTAGTHCRSA